MHQSHDHGQEAHAGQERPGRLPLRGDHANAEQALAQGLPGDPAEVDLVEAADAEEQAQGSDHHWVAVEQTGHQVIRAELLAARQVRSQRQGGQHGNRGGNRAHET
jgi:hypothetical protein